MMFERDAQIVTTFSSSKRSHDKGFWLNVKTVCTLK